MTCTPQPENVIEFSAGSQRRRLMHRRSVSSQVPPVCFLPVDMLQIEFSFSPLSGLCIHSQQTLREL